MTTQDLDLSRLQPWLLKHLPAFTGDLTAEKFAGGQSNPTFKIMAGEKAYVLRRSPPGKLLPSAHAVDREFRVMKSLKATNVPVPRVIAIYEETDLIGSMFYLMEFQDGRIFWDPAIPEAENQERSAIYDEMNRVLALLHNVNVDETGLADYGKSGNYYARQISRWTKQYRASETETVQNMERLISWLPSNIPMKNETIALVHGDYRLDNLIFHPREPKIIGIIDWELSTLGDPLADLAYLLMAWQFPRAGGMPGLAGINRAELGLPSDEEYVRSYCVRTGRSEIENWPFYMAFCFFRIAAILQGIKKRWQIGTASSFEAEKRAMLVGPLAALGAEYITDLY